MKYTALLISIIIACCSCENRDVNHGSGPNFNEIHEDINYHFDRVAIDGMEYLILERDRNNPHEGFGFMALNGQDIKRNQDSIKAYMKTILDFQIRIAAQAEQVPEKQLEKFSKELLRYHLQQSKSPFYIQEESEERESK
ncbi:MAG: hypothetical protein OCD76_16225 [Reichenbachiella sp.]